jgi:hypothetical protein
VRQRKSKRKKKRRRKWKTRRRRSRLQRWTSLPHRSMVRGRVNTGESADLRVV